MVKSAKKKVSKKSIGKNIRFPEKSYDIVSAFCKINGYNLGGFCSIAALDKVRNESINKLNK